jgi:hypothetical protein
LGLATPLRRFATLRARARIAWASLVVGAHARAAEPCVLIHDGAPPDAAWSRALDEARGRLGADAGGADCREVRVTLEGAVRGARLGFRTRDGREAVRRLGAASELVPTLEALLVTVAPPAEAPAPEVVNAVRDARAIEPSAPEGSAASLAIGAGARFASAPGAYLGPHLEAQGQVLLGPWVVGGLVEVAPSHVALGDAPEGFTLGTYGVAVAAGRRHAAGAAFVGYAARAGVQVLAEEAAPQPEYPAARALEVWQPRVGVEGYALVPLHGVFSLRLGASADAPVARFSNPASAGRGLPSFPRLGATASIGIEARLL